MMCSFVIDDEFKMGALLHDASEAYLLDMPSPIKKQLCNYRDIENNLMHLIADKFGFKYPLNEKIKEVDKNLLEWEWSSLMLRDNKFPEIECISPKLAEEYFLKEFGFCTIK